MSDLWSYSLDDFLLFSPRVYDRMLELHNQSIWPFQVLAILLGVAALYLIFRPSHDRIRIIFAIYGAAWIWIAWSFFWHRYASINWAAQYVTPLAALQGASLIWFGSIKGWLDFEAPRSVGVMAIVGILAFAVVGYPFMASVMGRTWSAAEIFGVSPDPTAVATVAMLTLARGRGRWLLMLFPFLWCLVAGLTLWIMKVDAFFIAPVCALACVLLALQIDRR